MLNRFQMKQDEHSVVVIIKRENDRLKKQLSAIALIQIRLMASFMEKKASQMNCHHLVFKKSTCYEEISWSKY